MLLIFIFAFLLCMVGFWLFKKERKDFFSLYLPVLILVFIFGSSLLAVIPFAGYEEQPIKKETKLSVLCEKDNKEYYLMISNDDEYIYKVIEPINEFGIVDENINVISGDNIKCFKSDSILSPTITEYTYKPKQTLFAPARCKPVKQYIFCIPKDLILE